MKRLLIIEPDGNIRRSLKQALDDTYEVSFATSASDAIDTADAVDPDIVITELSLAGNSGFEFIYEFRSYNDWRSVPIIIYTSQQVTDDLRQSIGWQEVGIAAYLYKPQAKLSDVVDALEQAVADES